MEWKWYNLICKIYMSPILFVLCGLPASGKTTFALCLAMQMAEKYNICFFSVEVKDRAIFRKYLNNKAMISTGKLKTQEYSHSEILEILATSEWTAPMTEMP